MRLLLLVCLFFISAYSFANESVDLSTNEDSAIPFKETDDRAISAEFIDVISIAILLIVISFLLLLAVKKYRSKLPGLDKLNKGQITLMEYKKLPSGLEFYLVKVKGKTVAIAKTDTQLLEIGLERMDANEHE